MHWGLNISINYCNGIESQSEIDTTTTVQAAAVASVVAIGGEVSVAIAAGSGAIAPAVGVARPSNHFVTNFA